MAKVKEVIDWLSKRDPEEVIALTGWWYQSDIENNNEVELTEEQWETIVDKHERDINRDIDDIVMEVTNA